MKTKNVLLTTLLKMEGDRLHHRYFYFDDGKQRTYCDSIIIPEAGAKYILSEELIDEIIVLGDGSTCAPGDQMRPLELGDPKDYNAIDITAMPEYNFFRYRMSQYMEGYDLEGLDVLENIDPTRKETLIALYDEIREELRHKYPQTYSAGMEFHLLSSDEYLFSRIKEKLDDAKEEADVRWLKRYAYTKLVKTRKMHILDGNKGVKVFFVPTKKSRNGRLDNLAAIMEAIREDDEVDVNLYMDMQGIGASDGFTLISLMLLLNDDVNSHLHVKQLITTHYDSTEFTNPIDNNDMARYELNLLVSGVNAFVQYGKVDLINEYWKNTGLHDEHIERLLFGMRCVDDGISLCHIGCLEYGIGVLKETFRQPPGEDLAEPAKSILEILEKSIRMDYGTLVEEEKLDILVLLQWSYRKCFYQQAMTIIESRIPYSIVHEGILYYAKDEETRNKMLDALQREYVNTPTFQRWSFNDPDHYFLKYYFIRKVNSRDPLDKRAVNYAELRVGALDPERAAESGLLPAYSLIADRPDLLKELMRAYYLIGPLRNMINHAENDRGLSSIVSESGPENPIITQLKTTLDDFIAAYADVQAYLAEKKASGDSQDILFISGEDFKTYSIAHKFDYPDYEKRNSDYRNSRSRDNNYRVDCQDNSVSINAERGQDIHIHIHLDN